MSRLIHGFAAAGLTLGVVAVVVGCSATARHPDAGRFGERAGNTSRKVEVDRIRTFSGLQGDAAASREETAYADALTLGKQLFSDPRLGRNGRSCNTCHVGGGTRGDEAQLPREMGHGPYKLPIPSLSGAAARYPKFVVAADGVITLEMMHNFCIRRFMGGKRLPLDSPEAFCLALYVTSLSAGSPMKIGD